MSPEVRSAMVTAGITLAGTGHPFGWVVFAVAIADDVEIARAVTASG